MGKWQLNKLWKECHNFGFLLFRLNKVVNKWATLQYVGSKFYESEAGVKFPERDNPLTFPLYI